MYIGKWKFVFYHSHHSRIVLPYSAVMPSPCTAVRRGLERGEAAVMFAGNNYRLPDGDGGSFGNLGLRLASPFSYANATLAGGALVLAGKCDGYGI